jgi:hypothetical protein
VEILEPSYIHGWWGNYFENDLEVPQKVKCPVSMWPSSFTPSYKHKETENMCPQKTYV